MSLRTRLFKLEMMGAIDATSTAPINFREHFGDPSQYDETAFWMLAMATGRTVQIDEITLDGQALRQKHWQQMPN